MKRRILSSILALSMLLGMCQFATAATWDGWSGYRPDKYGREEINAITSVRYVRSADNKNNRIFIDGEIDAMRYPDGVQITGTLYNGPNSVIYAGDSFWNIPAGQTSFTLEFINTGVLPGTGIGDNEKLHVYLSNSEGPSGGNPLEGKGVFDLYFQIKDGKLVDGWQNEILDPSQKPIENLPMITLSADDITAVDTTVTGADSKGTAKAMTPNVTLTVGGYTATPAGAVLSYEWYKDGVALANGADYTGVTTATLKIAKYEDAFAGLYSCKVYNTETGKGPTVANTITTFDLKTVKIAQATLNPPTLGSKATTSATLISSTGGSGTGAVTYGYATSNNIAAVTNWQSGLTFTGLTAGTDYYFFAKKATDANYNEAQSSSLKVTTDVTPTYGITVKTTPSFTAISYGDPQPTAQNVVFTNSGNQAQTMTATLMGTNAASFTLTGSANNVAAGGDATFSLRPNDKLGAGTYTVQVKATSTNNTIGATTADITLTVNKKQLSWTVGNVAATKTYDGTMTGATLSGAPTVTGAAAGETVTAAFKPGKTATYTDNANVGTSHTYSVTQADFNFTGATANYILPTTTLSYTNGIITAAPISGKPTISGTAFVGDTLTAGITGITPAGAQSGLTYQWKSSGVAIPGATNGTYILTASEVGKNITVEVTATGNYSGTQASDPAGPVAKKPIGGTVSISDNNSGKIEVGTILSPNLTGISPAGAQASTYTYSWKNNGTEVGTGSTYIVKTGETSITLTVTVATTDPSYTGTLTSAPVAPGKESIISVTIPTSNNGTIWGSQLTVGTVKPAGAQTQVDYQWTRDGVVIPGATSSSYTTTIDDLGKKIAVTVTAKSGSTFTGSATSPEFGPMTAKPQMAPAAPVIVGGPYYDKVVVETIMGQEYLINTANDTTTGTPTWIPAVNATHEFTGLTPGTPYYVFTRLAAKTGYAASPASSSVTQTTKTLGVPGAPINLAASGNGQLVVTWAAPADDGGSPITKYTIQLDAQPAIDVTAGLTHTFTGLTNGTEYTITIAAVNAQGTGANATVKAIPTAPVTPPSGGGSTGPTTYTVTYDVGKDGELGSGKTSETVVSGKFPANVPTVTAKPGMSFKGWSLDGKTVVDPTTQKITKSTTFTAIYETVSETGGFNKDRVDGYIIGLPDGTFNSDGQITRAEVAMILARLMWGELEANQTYFAPYDDVSPDSWYANAVGYLSGFDIIKGFGDGTFHPDQKISRAELVAMVMRVDGLVSSDIHFSDISADHWAAAEIESAAKKGYVKGFDDGLFHPEALITRAETVTIINRVLGWSDEIARSTGIFPDVSETLWAIDDIDKSASGVIR